VARNRRDPNMFIPTIVMGVLAIVLILVGYYKGQGEHIEGLKSGMNMILGILPLLVFAFIIAGMAQVLFPQELLLNWIGKDSGFRGILIGTIAGGLAPGGPYVSLPIELQGFYALGPV